MSIKIVIADDDSLIRESLKIILGSDKEIEVLEIFENGLKAVEYINNNQVDIAVLDVRMPLLNGVDTIKKITTNTKSIILTTFDEDEYIEKALKNGASGYILKNTEPLKIIQTIKMVYGGNSVIQDEVLNKIKNGFNSNNLKEDISIFTEREIDIIKEITKGYSNREISKNLFISEGTIKNYITSILQKTNLEHRTQIAIKYLNKI